MEYQARRHCGGGALAAERVERGDSAEKPGRRGAKDSRQNARRGCTCKHAPIPSSAPVQFPLPRRRAPPSPPTLRQSKPSTSYWAMCSMSARLDDEVLPLLQRRRRKERVGRSPAARTLLLARGLRLTRRREERRREDRRALLSRLQRRSRSTMTARAQRRRRMRGCLKV